MHMTVTVFPLRLPKFANAEISGNSILVSRPFGLAIITLKKNAQSGFSHFKMALLRVHSPSDALSCMSEELRLQLEDALWREKQEELMVSSQSISYVSLIQLYTRKPRFTTVAIEALLACTRFITISSRNTSITTHASRKYLVIVLRLRTSRSTRSTRRDYFPTLRHST